ncbi:MAG: response regulator [Lachnospiraceae bacterium]|nr:response regulator [Lachnospiraceae bacterium]
MVILIVDDEHLVRITLQSMLEELYGDENRILQADCAEKMLLFLEKEHIDLVFLDINMPGIKGLEAMERAKKPGDNIEWCVLTGYNYFEYAKKALNLGASRYILKPPDPEELKQFVDQVRLERQNKSQKEHGYFVEQICKSLYMNEEFYFGEPGRFQLYFFLIDTFDEMKKRKIYQDLYQSIEFYVAKQLPAEETKYGLFFLHTGELCMLIKGEARMRMSSFLQLHFNRYQEEAILNGYTRELSGLQELKAAVKDLEQLKPQRYYCKNHEMVQTERLETDSERIPKENFVRVLEKLTISYQSDDLAGFQLCLKNLKEEWIRENEKYFTAEVKNHVSILWNARLESKNLADVLLELKDLFHHKKLQEEAGEDIINRIKEYVKNNYMEDVSSVRIAELFHIKPTYLSRIFHEKTGQKYIDCVTEIRMDRAKEMIEQGETSVKHISELVGYASEKHFSKTFKKAMGESPAQYRARIMNTGAGQKENGDGNETDQI